MLRHSADANARQERHAQRAALAGVHQRDVASERIGEDLPPDRTTRAAAGHANFGHGKTQLTDERERIAQAKGDAFDDRACQVRARVA